MQNDVKQYYKHAQIQKKFMAGAKFINPFPLFKGMKLGVLNTAQFVYNNLKSQPNMNQIKDILPAKMISSERLINKQGVLRAVWIGHATVLIQDGPVNFITDPIFNIKVPDAFYGYKRLNPLPVSIVNLPKIHGVILSHDHHDHCNLENLKEIHQRFGSEFFAGKESSDMFPKGAKVHEMNWTETVQFTAEDRKYKIYFVPACHWSGRGMTDRFKRLWGGFVIVTPENKKIYYSGDTGYCQIFKEIGKEFGQIDLALLPIGAYKPRDFLQYQHIDPYEAVKIHQQINCKQSLAIHWATFQLACQKALEPLQELQASLLKLQVKPEDFVVFLPGNILTCRIPVLRPVFQLKHPNQITFFGHSTFLLQLSNINIFINPILSGKLQERSRYTDFPCKIQDLPKIDIILANNPLVWQDFTHAKFTNTLIMTNQALNSLNKYSSTSLKNQSVEIQLKTSETNSCFIIKHQKRMYQIYQNLSHHFQTQSPIDFVFLPLRPFDNSPSDILSFTSLVSKSLPLTIIPTNWGSFQHRQQNILQPLNDLQTSIIKSLSDSKIQIFLPTIGKTVLI